jgi:translation initiation factor IF-2
VLKLVILNMSNIPENKEFRPPVVVVLGHVDHGKTSLLDAVRKTRIVDKESGGITQHIGAYQAEIAGKLITFLDTPGHEAFTAIRSRGARVADVAILVVAADEGIKPQTKEAIKIIGEAGIPFIVAINKMDKEGANPQKIKQELASENVLVEDWGGKVPVVEISAKQNKNIDGLLDMVLLVSELEDLKEDLSRPAEGVIIESHLDKRKGYVATALIKKGILKTGDWIVAGKITGKIKFMEDFLGKQVTEGVPSQPVQIVGWSDAPAIGKEIRSAESKNEAESIAVENTELTPLFQSFKIKESPEQNHKYMNIVFKSDVSSSLEAIDNALKAIKSEEVSCRVVTSGIGNISEGDVKMAIGTKAEVIGFRVDIDGSAVKLAEKEKIKTASFDIIYELIEYIRKEMEEYLDPEIKINFLGKIKILAVFKTEGKSQIIGGKVTSGKAIRGALVNVVRNNAKLLSGRITQLQQNKQDASEVKEGLECGMKFEKTSSSEWDIKEGDVLEVFEEEKIKRSL